MTKKIEKSSSAKNNKNLSVDIDIDEIFSNTKKKSSKEKEMKKIVADPEEEKEIKNCFTEDGLRIYKWEELVSNSKGDSPLCPFDCNCCF